MTIWFTSDTHFSHARILELGDGRPFKDIQEHNEMLIKNWNDRVSTDDIAFHLGDVALGPWPEGLDCVKRLNGFKILVPGNHDRVSSVEKAARRERFWYGYAEAFQDIEPEVTDVELDGRLINLSHYPYNGDSQKDQERFADLRPVDDGTPLLHGHNHCGPSERESVSLRGTPQFAVGVDANDYAPVHEDVILEWLNRVT